MKVGIEISIEKEVRREDTALFVGSGELEVYATPKMCALMEEAASKCIAPYLEEGKSSVGTMLSIKHLSATPIGMKVKGVATVKEIDNRRIVFDVKAYDECGLIGEGEHERFIISKESFLSKTYSKKA